MNRTAICVLEQADQVCLSSFLQRPDGRRLKTHVRLEVVRDLSDQPLERQFSNEELGRSLHVHAGVSICIGNAAPKLRAVSASTYLVPSDLAKSHRPGLVSPRPLHHTYLQLDNVREKEERVLACVLERPMLTRKSSSLRVKRITRLLTTGTFACL